MSPIRGCTRHVYGRSSRTTCRARSGQDWPVGLSNYCFYEDDVILGPRFKHLLCTQTSSENRTPLDVMWQPSRIGEQNQLTQNARSE